MSTMIIIICYIPFPGRLRIEVSLPSTMKNHASAQIKRNYSGVLMAKTKKDEFYATVASNGPST